MPPLPLDFPQWLLAFLPILILLAILDIALKIWTAWLSARRNQLVWFICIFLFNTAGILPVIYLLMFGTKLKKR